MLYVHTVIIQTKTKYLFFPSGHLLMLSYKNQDIENMQN